MRHLLKNVSIDSPRNFDLHLMGQTLLLLRESVKDNIVAF